MSDLQEKIYQMMQKPVLAGLASVTEDGKPWVRYVMVQAQEDLTIRLATFVGARKVEQVKNNPEVHLTCGVNDPAVMTPYIQVQGRAEFTTDKQQRHEFWCEMLGNYFQGPDDPNYGIIIIKPYRIEYCVAGSPEPEVWSV